MKKQILLLCLIAIITQVGLAQSIFSNSITGTNPNTANPYTTGQVVDPNMTVSGIGRGAGITGTNANDRYNASSWNTTSIDLTAYFNFTLTPNTNKNIDLTSFTYTGTSSSTGPTSFAFRSNLDGFMTNITGAIAASGTTVDLSGPQFQNRTSPIEFRLYGWGASASTGTFSVNDFTFAGALPATLIAFEATTDQKTTQLHFTTATEKDNDRFEIERSNDGLVFDKIGEVKGAGNSTKTLHYSFEDKSPRTGTNYYRLRQVDFDGQFTHSPVRSVTIGTTKAVKLFPTPVAESMNVQLDQPYADDAQWQVLDMTGRVISEGVFVAEQVQFAIAVVTLTEGTYVLRITAGNEVVTKQFYKQ